jgi:hypothetical protein
MVQPQRFEKITENLRFNLNETQATILVLLDFWASHLCRRPAAIQKF